MKIRCREEKHWEDVAIRGLMIDELLNIRSGIKVGCYVNQRSPGKRNAEGT